MDQKFNIAYLTSLIAELRNLPKETEWVEFKTNKNNPEEIGEYLSALANSAALFSRGKAYMVWGIANNSHDLIGTNFQPTKTKVGNEELENWLLRLLSPKINFRFYEFPINDKPIVLLEISSAFRHPVRFKNQEFVRIGTYKKKLKDHPEKERELWRIFDQTPFERRIAAEHLTAEDVLKLLDYPAYFDLLAQPLPESRDLIISALQADEMIESDRGGRWNVHNLGAILFSRKLKDFSGLRRKAVRVIVYRGESRVETVREQEGVKGYACGFEGIISFVLNLLPTNEIIEQALRKVVPMFPELAVRELIANAVIHQDLHQTGTGPMIEIFSNRMEITNPGLPLVKTKRFLDSPPKSRNETLASFMRRIGVCEERGSGIDKVVFQTELFQLPAPDFAVTDEHTRAVLFSHRDLREMTREDRVRACYLHACLKYVQREYMTNSSVRKRFGIDEKNSAMASRFIKEAIEAEEIRPYDQAASKKFMKYVPIWA